MPGHWCVCDFQSDASTWLSDGLTLVLQSEGWTGRSWRPPGCRAALAVELRGAGRALGPVTSSDPEPQLSAGRVVSILLLRCPPSLRVTSELALREAVACSGHRAWCSADRSHVPLSVAVCWLPLLGGCVASGSAGWRDDSLGQLKEF